MRVVVGLGNPGRQYAASRHNVGFAVVETVARRWRLSLAEVQDGVRLADGSVAGEQTLLVQPQMYMNLSGHALARIEPSFTVQDLIVIHDDLDLEVGCVRVKRGGGTAGHHGLDSVVEHFGSEFTRVRIGIGRTPRGVDGADYVLSPFDTQEGDVISAAVERAADAVETIIRAGEQTAMNCFNRRTQSDTTDVVSSIGRK